MARDVTHRMILLETMGICLLVELGTKLLPFQLFWNLLNRIPIASERRSSPPDEALAEIPQLCEKALTRLPWHISCLKKTLTLFVLLRRCGIRGDLRIGMAKDRDSLRAHSWLEHGGEIVGDIPCAVEEFSVSFLLRSKP